MSFLWDCVKNKVARFTADGMGLVGSGGTIKFPKILAQSAVPVILAPNGTVDAAGAITLGTALPTTYSGGAWVRLPAGAVVGGLAGLYWTVFSSTTVGAVKTLFVDPATAFTPYVPSVALVAAVGSGVAYVQTTGADITLANITAPGGVMGVGGVLRISDARSMVNSAGAKVSKIIFGGVALQTVSATTTTGGLYKTRFANRGEASNVYGTDIHSGVVTSSYSTINTGADQTLAFTGNLAVASDFLVLEGFIVEVLPS